MNIEKVIVKDYGRQGLALFFPETQTNHGMIDCWSTLMTYEKGECAYTATSSMCGGDASMGYFYQGKKPKPDDPRIAVLLNRYENSGVEYATPTALKVVFKDSQTMRLQRWKK